MNKNHVLKLNKILLIISMLFVSSCSHPDTATQDVPRIVPGIEVKHEVKQPLGIIGEIEPIYLPPIKSPFISRIDTGAQTTSIDVYSQKIFERDGKKWVSFGVINRETGEKHTFEKKIEEIKKIKRIDDSEERIFVVMDIKIGDMVIKEKVSLAQRDKFNYQILVGRNLLTGRAVVDTALKNTLK
ncbi:MAG: RimK/LysX family protein [Lactobacillaceae bacterium]|jgi:hypothetical protein|nr:RimK/LysX family protein [Lactobacillaceae bacterium]